MTRLSNLKKYYKWIIPAVIFIMALTVAPVKAGGQEETEDNDSVSTANAIQLNTEYYGKLTDKNSSNHYSGETDYYKFTISEEGYFNLSFGPKEPSEKVGSGWALEIYHDNDLLYTTSKITKSFLTPNFPMAKGSNIYVKVYATDTYNDNCPTDIYYFLKANMIVSDSWEKESNDERTTANPIQWNKEYFGNLLDKNPSNYYSGEADYYKVKIEDNGYFNLTIGPASIDGNVANGWTVAIYQDNTLIYEGKAVKTTTTPNFALKKGTMVYVKITASDTYSDNCPTNVDYKFSINFNQSKVWESENNDVKTDANTISLNKQYYGNILDKNESGFYSGEVDYYKVKLTKDGYFNISIAPKDDIEFKWNGWKIELYDGNTLLYTLNDVINGTTPNFGLKKGSTIYIKITEANSYYGSCPTNIDYAFKVNFKENKYWEKESNDKKSEATALTAGKKYTGNLLDKDSSSWTSSETDYYKYTASKAGTLSIGFGLKSIDIENVGNGWALEVSIKNKVVFKKDNITDLYKTIKSIKVKKGDVVYLKVTPSSAYNSPTYIDYSIMVKMK